MKAASTRGGLKGNNPISVKNSYNVGIIVNTSQEKPAGILGYSWHSDGLDDEKCYCIDNVEIVLNFINNNKIHDTKICTQEYMQSQNFVDELNDYVDTYNEEHKNDENFVKLSRWKYSERNYPTFE